MKLLLTVLLCLSLALSAVDFCGEGELTCCTGFWQLCINVLGPSVIYNVTSTVYQLEGREILLVPGGPVSPVSKFLFWRRSARNSNTTTLIGQK